MQYRRLGRCNKKISVIGLGGAAISGEGGGHSFGKISEKEAISLVQYAFEKGINTFDTAPIYGKGLSEKRLGIALKAIRDKAFIISKCGITWNDAGRVNHHNHPKICRKMLEQSLRDLQSDYIDLYMIHHPDSKIDIRYPMETLAKAKGEGKIHFIGLSNTNEGELTLAREVAHVDAIENEFNFFSWQKTKELLGLLEKWDIGAIGYGTLAKGILAGSVTKERTYDSCDWRSWAKWFRKDKAIKKQIAWSQETLMPLLKEKKISPLAFALQFSLSFPSLSCALCGPRSIGQLDTLLEGLNSPVSPKVFDEIGKLL